VVELADRILSAVFDAEASEIMEEHLRSSGVEIITNNSVDEITGGDRVDGVILRDGKRIDSQMVIIAIGVRPNLHLVKDTDIEVNRGIMVDNHMETSIKGIFAAGDVAEAYDMLNGDRRPIPIWLNGYRQGRIAGYNMAGFSAEYEGGFTQNSIEVLGLPTISVGITNPEGEAYEILKRSDGRKYRKIVLKNDVIVGAIFIGCIDRAGIITGLIRDRINVKNFKDALLDDNFGFVSFSKELRKEKLK
ncbi:MAG: NAD(P)/FAD-dependent oxidoreductase, partial [Candidatus Syntropharchaeia archaeon]